MEKQKQKQKTGKGEYRAHRSQIMENLYHRIVDEISFSIEI